jgi:3-isopropylmalate/(R)-2-methylmalate dehydratase small subunit
MTMTGRTWVLGDDIDTDQLAPGQYMKGGIETMANHCLENALPGFAAGAAPGDLLVAGRNFGMGSSREQAVEVLLHLGIRAVIARSFAGIFYRNALNLGLPVFVSDKAASIEPGTRVEIDIENARVTAADTGDVMQCEPLPDFLLAMIADGGLIAHLEKRFQAQKEGV